MAAAAGVLLMAIANPRTAAEGAMADDATPTSSPYRGFGVPELDAARLNDAANKWHANIVRFMMRPQREGRDFCHCSSKEAWQKMMHDLPGELDVAKQLHVAVVLALFEAPIEHNPAHLDREALSAYWSDNNNLQALTEAWTDVARICANRDQVIWLDLVNEPLDWNAPGKSPTNWPSWAQSLINSIRQIDQRHQIVIEPGDGGLPDGFKSLPRLKGDGLIYSFHQYEPYPYTMQGIDAMRDTNRAHEYPQRQLSYPGLYPSGYWDKKRLEGVIRPAVEFQKRYGVRMYVGEFGVARWAPGAVNWLRDNIDLYEQHGFDWTYVVFRGSPIWGLEHSNEFQNPVDLHNSGQYTDRGKLLLDYLSRNATQP